MTRKEIKRKIKKFIAEISCEDIEDIKGSTFLDDVRLSLDDSDFKNLRDEINDEFDLCLKKKQLKSCVDINDIVDLVEEELEEELGEESIMPTASCNDTHETNLLNIIDNGTIISVGQFFLDHFRTQINHVLAAGLATIKTFVIANIDKILLLMGIAIAGYLILKLAIKVTDWLHEKYMAHGLNFAYY